jgi:tetratricopeptide (TPR) repeat protein
MHVAYYYKGMDWLNWSNKAKARELFDKSLKVKATYTPPLYQLALMDFESRKYKAVLDSCEKINSKLKPDTDTRYNTVKLAESVLTIYIDSIRQLIVQNDIDNSFKLLETSIGYAKRIDGVKTFEAFDVLYGQLYATVYNNLVGQARLLVESGKLDEAHIFADSAGQLRLMHPQYEINPEKENGVMNKLYKAWIDKGKAANQINKPEEALYAFDKATAICRKYKAVPCTDELNALALKSHSNKYAQLIEAVKRSLPKPMPIQPFNCSAMPKTIV